jgi:uncharacterized protein DUF4112
LLFFRCPTISSMLVSAFVAQRCFLGGYRAVYFPSERSFARCSCYRGVAFLFCLREENQPMVGTHQPPYPSNARQSIVRLEALARLMDGAFVVPGTSIRFGLDGIIGLIPVAGDVIAGLVSTYLIWEARQLGAPRWLIARMLANAFLDTAIGSIPVVGDAFDVLFRANMKNMALLRRHLEKKGFSQHAGPVIEVDAVRVS